jgi:hypothetical protein
VSPVSGQTARIPRECRAVCLLWAISKIIVDNGRRSIAVSLGERSRSQCRSPKELGREP